MRGKVIFVDEAGQLGIRDLARLMEIVGSSSHVLLAGDTGQHASVSRGDPMRLLEDYADLPLATVKEIHRQKELGYREAIRALSEGDTKAGFALLEKIGAIVEVHDHSERCKTLAGEYLTALETDGVAPLVVSPTHAEGRAVTRAIRERLAEAGLIGEERKFMQLRPTRWEEAEKQLPENYSAGMVLKFHQNAKGIRRGSVLPVLEVDADRNVWLGLPDGKRQALDWKEASRFQVFESAEIGIAPGDLVRITRNGTSENGRRLVNGAILPVKSIGDDGKLTLANGLVLSDARRVADVGFFRSDIFQSDWFWSGDSLFVSVLGKAHCVNLGDGTVKSEKLHIGELAKNSSPDHKMTALGTGFGGFAIVDLDAKKVQQMPIRASLKQVYWLGDERAIVLANSDQFQVFNRSSGEVERTFEPKFKVTSIISSSPDRKTLLVGSAAGGVFLDLDSTKPLPLKTHMESGAWASPNTLLCSNGSTDSEERGIWLLGCDGTAEKISSEPADANRAIGNCTPMTEMPGGCVYVSSGDLWRFDFTSRKLVQLTHGEKLPCNLALLAK